MLYQTFTRTFWKENPRWPNGLEPKKGRKTYHGTYSSAAEARAACQVYNSTQDPGRLSRKMEFTEV